MSTMRNSVMLIGRPGAEPEMKSISNNQKVARFRIAVNETYMKSNNERVENTSWFNIVAWNATADRVMKTVKKGRLIALEGSLRNNDWKDKEGKLHSSSEIWVNDLFPIDVEKQ